MNLYLISQNERIGYDTYDYAVVAAETSDEAKKIHPSKYVMEKEDWDNNDTWASSPSSVEAKLIGKALDAKFTGIVLASFNAG